jgi:hypothetical protein
MDLLILNIILPLTLGVVTTLLVDWIRTKRQHPSLSVKERVIIGAVVALTIAVVILFLPPYKVSGINWCVDSNQSIKVTGRLTTWLLGMPASDGEVQIKIFPVGENSPIWREKVARTSQDGTFTITFLPPLPPADKQYLINTAYNRRILSLWEKWEISDFRMGELSRCSIP